MSAQFRGVGGKGYVYVPGRTGWKLRATGTSNRHLVRAMKRMVEDLHQRRRFDILDPVIARRLTLGTVYDAYVANRLDGLVQALESADLAAHVDPWIADYLSNGKSARNAPIYRSQVRSLVGDRYPGHQLTPAAVKAWLGAMRITSGAKRGKLMALRSFVRYCVEVGVLPSNPIREVETPKKNPASLRWEPQSVDEAIVAAAPDACYAALFAFVHATGADLSPVLELTERGDIDLARGVARLRGTKTAKRHVHEAIIEAWALPALETHLRHMMPHVRPWAGITRYMSAWHHAKAAEAAEAPAYTLRMARHSVAVRARKAGRSFEWIAAQLGNSVYQVATVYGRFSPTTAERLADIDAKNTGNATFHATDRATRAPPASHPRAARPA